MTFSQVKRVSVVVPNYNYAKYLEKRIKSILRQTYPIYELIILDDNSNDESVKIIEKEIQKIKIKCPDLKLKFIKNKVNSGKAMSQWKKGFEEATGDFVWIAEADDLSNKNFLKEVIKGFDKDGVVLSYSESMIINSYGLMIAPNFRWSRDKEKTGHYKKSYIKDGKKEIEEILAIRCTIPNVSAVVFKNDKKFLKYFDEALKFTQVGDWYFYTKILEGGKISYNKKSLNRFRLHKNSKTGESKKDNRHYKEILDMHAMFKNNYKLADKILGRMNTEETRVSVKHGIIE